MTARYCVIMTTTATAADARKLTERLLERKLAACVQHVPVNSFYTFEDKACDEPEILLLIKTRRELYAAIEALVKAEHPYKVPELIMMPVENGLTEYFSWIDANTGL